ncbi:uncharacterized protein LOC110862936 [Folsomia candida]|uniref:uncharacterized protein LOC110862936 n=1 Tax=Folsomia candida TaxID=158441 RepID=UPI001604CEDC|nr:uncharacterized protein LOC110862936 [Folsomia candida]
MLPNSYTSASSIRDSQFRIGGEHPVFGHNPWTQQSKGCGQQGDMISAGFQYVLQYNDTEAGHSTPERTFVKEFVKFRYGVFEETGFENDPIYPTAYYHGTGSKDERKPTSCTNRPLTGNWYTHFLQSSSSLFLAEITIAHTCLCEFNINPKGHCRT